MAARMAEWVDIAVTLALGVVGLSLVHSLRRQIAAKVAEKRFDSYAALWEKLKVASPLRTVTNEGPLTREERRTLYDELTDWYYDGGNGMLLSEQARNVYLAAKENLVCEVDELRPESLRAKVKQSVDPDGVRGWASIRQFSLLRTAIRGDIAIYTSPWGRVLDDEDREFLLACGVDLDREPWRTSARGVLPGRRSRGDARVTPP
jgi:hypothetical protein